jgi:hypothetical protein
MSTIGPLSTICDEYPLHRQVASRLGRRSALADRTFGASIPNDFTNGARGMAKSVRGAKKYVRTRFRFHENAETRRLANTIILEEQA